MKNIILGLLLLTAPAQGMSEYLDRFNAQIAVHPDASLTVREEIDYVNVSLTNKHGIVRDFPTRYEDESGKSVRVALEILSVERDGQKEPFKTTPFDVGTRIFVGDPHKLVGPGAYRYVITYDTNRQILLHDKADELYWNVNGNWWVLPIKNVSATITFSAGVSTDQIAVAAYTGPLGVQGHDYKIEKNSNGSITIASTRPFAPGEGLTISLAIPKGIIHHPTFGEETSFFMGHHLGIILMLLGFFAVLMLYLVGWIRLRRTQTGLVIPLFHPINNLPPSAHRYLLKMYFDNRQLSADIVQLAVHGFIRIEEIAKSGNARYQLTKLAPKNAEPKPLQKNILDALFGESATGGAVVVLSPSARDRVEKINTTMSSWLSSNLNKNFKFEYRYIVVGLISTLLLGILAYALEPTGPLSWLVVMLFLATIFLAPLGFWLHRIYTPDGCKLRDQVKGFLLYLTTAESERIAIVGTPPTKTPQLYEIYLPYAIALGAEKQWTAQFAPVFERLLHEDAAYVPIWFVGHGHHGFGAGFDPDLFVHDIAAFSRSLNIPTQTSPTRVSSGMGGGGFSGGGRGGGGGGSW